MPDTKTITRDQLADAIHLISHEKTHLWRRSPTTLTSWGCGCDVKAQAIWRNLKKAKAA